MLTTPISTVELQVKLSELSLVCQFLNITPVQWPMTNFGILFSLVLKLRTQWPLLAKLVTSTWLLVTPMESLMVFALPKMEHAFISSSKWETHGVNPNITDHGLLEVPNGPQHLKNKLIFLELMKVNTGYHLISGEPSTPKLSILITETTGLFNPSKVNHLNSLLHNNNLDGFHSRTPLNKMLFSVAINGKLDSSHQVARTNILHRATLSSSMIALWPRWKLAQVRPNATVEQWNCQNLPLVNTPSELFPSVEVTRVTSRSGRWDPSQNTLLFLLSTEATHTLQTTDAVISLNLTYLDT